MLRRIPAAMALNSSLAPTIRVNAGGPGYTDPAGNVWQADPGFTGVGGSWSPGNVPIANTTTPTLYQSEAWGDIQYQFAVANGTYNVTLKFAELEVTQPGQRTFNVYLNGQQVLQNFDVVAAAGAWHTAVDKQFPVNVTNGAIQVRFEGTRWGAEIEGMEISPVAPATNATATAGGGQQQIRVNAGGPAYTDPAGNVWQADPGFTGVGGSWSPGNVPIANTTTPALYQSEAYGDIQYQFAVANGTYNVTLKFAELEVTQAGQRTFNVYLNGQQVLQNFDVVAAAGAWHTAVDKQFPVNVTNGAIQVRFEGTRWGAEIEAMEISPVAPAANATATAGGGQQQIRVNAGGPAYTDPAGNVWQADPGFSGVGGSWSPGNVPIANTTTPTLYQSEAWGNIQYQFAVANGTYNVTLKFAELEVTQPGQRMFNVYLNGQQVLQNFDVVAAAGAWQTAVDKEFPVNVTNGAIQIRLQNVRWGAELAGFQISLVTPARNAVPSATAGGSTVPLTSFVPPAPPSTYNAVSDLAVRTKPALPALGTANQWFVDPTFGTRILRVTDQN
ncbi:MAG TPA: malectin, partial [Bryobacteraceae bacterium]|nr:malectin [Bryobacteraceae bacterium]